MKKTIVILALALIVASSFAAAVPVVETIKCVFTGSRDSHYCSSKYGACFGRDTCSVSFRTDTNDPTVEWKSRCGGAALTTTNDGKPETIKFTCDPFAQPVYNIVGYAVAKVPKAPKTTLIKEYTTCTFKNSLKEQWCQSDMKDDKGNFYGCKGKDLCIVELRGNVGDKITWKSSCKGTQINTFSGKSHLNFFNCMGVK